MTTIHIKRAYEGVSGYDGVRILVDRIWPRGISKQDIQIDFWFKEIAPSNSLRKWFGHDPTKFHDFKLKYKEELTNNEEKGAKLVELKGIVQQNKRVTLIYGAKDKEHNQAVVLKELLEIQ